MSYKVPFVDVPTQYRRLRKPIMDVIDQVLARGNLILREELREFESGFAEFVGSKYAVGVSSGYDALHLTLRALGIGPGDEVITVSHTCVATVSAIVHVGASPVFVDIGADFNMDMGQLDDAVTARTRAVLPVHLNGHACDMERLLDIAGKRRVLVVEDPAQALGARFDGRMLGTFGRAAAFSLYPFKMLGGFGDGGIVVTDDPEIARKVAVLRDYGQDRETGEILDFGFNARLDNLQAAILDVKLPYLPEWIARRRQIAEIYREGLRDVPFLTLPHFDDARYFDVYLNYSVLTARRDELVTHLKASGVEPLVPISLAKPIHLHEALGFKGVRLPRTEDAASRFVYLPINPELGDEQVRYVIECIRSFRG